MISTYLTIQEESKLREWICRGNIRL